MKVKTSVTLSQQVVQLIDKHSHDFRSRSEFMEQAARALLASLARTEADRRDLEIINRNADKLNAEAQDVLTYQVPL
jgi:Arc/MetJ-type ribon-helix-helix transcriptional regulator